MAKPLSVLVLGTGNSCRSIMAEVLINSLGKGMLVAKSAGSSPAGFIHPKTIETLKRHGVDPQKSRSKSWNELSLQSFVLIVSICDEVSRKAWPVFPHNPRNSHWHISDPAEATGDDAEISTSFDETFLTIKKKVEYLIAHPPTSALH